LFRAPIEASRVAIPVVTPSYSARSHIRAVPRPQQPLFLGAVVFLFGNGLASRSGGIVCARKRVGKCDQHQASPTDAGSNNSQEISPFHPIGSPSGRAALCIPIFASISQDACELAHIAARISQRDCARLPRTERQETVPPEAPGEAQRRPSWAATIDRQIASPIPIPVGLVVKNASKIWPLSLESTPAPDLDSDRNLIRLKP
jgi:hypothetical protein